MTLPSILIVDDEPGIRDCLTDHLQAHTNWGIYATDNDSTALKLLSYGCIDVVTTDVYHSPWGGIELCWTIKSNYPYVKVFVLTAHTDRVEEIKAVSADFYANKPIMLDVYLAVLRGLLFNHSSPLIKSLITKYS